MSIHDKELRRRVAGGEEFEQTAQWFIQKMAERDVEREEGLTEYELTFFRRCVLH